jgi:cupin 2 domain-containing protein
MRTGSVTRNLSPAALGETFDTLVQGRGVRIQWIVSRGQVSPSGFWYDQEESEYVLLVEGQAELEFADGVRVALRPGDWVDIAAHERHRVAWTALEEDTVWLAVFYASE